MDKKIICFDKNGLSPTFAGILEMEREEGREEGRKIGIELGRQKGRKEILQEIIERLMEKGFRDESISDLTGIPAVEITAIRSQI